MAGNSACFFRELPGSGGGLFLQHSAYCHAIRAQHRYAYTSGGDADIGIAENLTRLIDHFRLFVVVARRRTHRRSNYLTTVREVPHVTPLPPQPDVAQRALP